ncbi:MAG: tetratricopeptide repeat protein [Dehalococcoidia bacterium]
METQCGEAKLKRERTQEAITFAMEGRWDEAIAANESIIEAAPNDINALNRLGKALTEKGRYKEAIEAYNRTLGIDAKNIIARKNLRRLSLLKEKQPAPSEDRPKAVPRTFIEETGKAGVARLDQPAPREILVKMSAGDIVQLKLKKQRLVVENEAGEYLGQVEARINTRLSKLMKGGNKYSAAIASISDSAVKIIITETYQHPKQLGRPSFPAKLSDGFRSYVKGSILKYELGDEEETYDDSGDVVDTEEDTEVLPDSMTLMTSETSADKVLEEEA